MTVDVSEFPEIASAAHVVGQLETSAATVTIEAVRALGQFGCAVAEGSSVVDLGMHAVRSADRALHCVVPGGNSYSHDPRRAEESAHLNEVGRVTSAETRP